MMALMHGDLLNQLEVFSPAWWARGAQMQTVLGHYTNHPRKPAKEHAVSIDLGDGDQLIAIENRPDDVSNIEGVVLLMHGLGGDADAKYMLSSAHRFVENNWVTFRLNHRGAGAGAGLATRLYNSGLSNDISKALKVVAESYPRLPIIAIGYSMSGNALLKYLGEQQEAAIECIAGAIAVNPPIDLGLCVAELESARNWVYHLRFTGLLRDQHLANSSLLRVDSLPKKSRARSIRQFDEQVTVPAWGYKNPDDYYRKASAIHYIDSIAAPTLVITCDDDPFVSVEQFHKIAWPASVALHITQGGGHMGYLCDQQTHLGDRRWLDYATLACSRYFASQVHGHE